LWGASDDPITRTVVRQFCVEHGYDWPAVVKELRRVAMERIIESEVDSHMTRTPGGVLINQNAFESFERRFSFLMPNCGFRALFINARTLSTFEGSPERCGSSYHQDCAQDDVDVILPRVGAVMSEWSEAFVARAAWEKTLIRRISDRRQKFGGSLFWFRRSDDSVYFIAERKLKVNGRREPRVWTAYRIDDATQLLADTILRLPGLVTCSRNAMPSRRSSAGDGMYVRLGSVRHDESDAFVQQVRERLAEAGLGFDPWNEDVPASSVPAVKRILKDVERAFSNADSDWDIGP
jgi:hypothetical protein